MRTITEKMKVLSGYLGGTTAPVQTVALANALGLKVYHAKWPDEVNGKIQRDAERGGHSGFAIYVNGAHPITRRRFTTAHEIAHYILHEGKIGDGIFDDALYRSGLSSKVEAQANGLAADILMPWSLLNQHISTVGINVVRLAEIFQVSERSMNIRLERVHA